jgi:cell division protein FtsB
VQWDRLARTAMLGVTVALAYLYLSAGLRMFSAWGEGRHDSAQLHSLEAQNHTLRRQAESVSAPGAVQTQARRLGMVKQGEQTYVVSNLPDN